MCEKKRIADAIHERALNLAYFITRSLQDGDLQNATEILTDELDTYRTGSGGAGATLTRLQSLGLIQDLDQETLDVPSEEELNKIVQKLILQLPNKLVIY